MTKLVLHDWQADHGARFMELNGAELVGDYGDPAAEHHALRSTVGVIDLSTRGRLVLLGADRHKLLNGQVTNNVRDLRPGQGCYAALVNQKGKILSDLTVFALADELLLDCEPGRSPAVAARLEQFIIADDVQIVDAAPLYGLLSVQGPRAARAVEGLALFPALPGEALAHLTVVDPALGSVYLMNHPRFGTRGFDLFAPVAALSLLADQLAAQAGCCGGRLTGWTAMEVARIESGIPRFGIDMDETNLAPEAGIEARAISYTKGCYSGQEVIARIRTYGQVAKSLRGLRLEGELPELPARGTKLFREGREVGYLTSSTRSPELGVPIALGYVRRECNAPGTELCVGSNDAGLRGVIVALPFVGPNLA